MTTPTTNVLIANKSACEHIIEKYGPFTCGVNFSVLLAGINAVLVAQAELPKPFGYLCAWNTNHGSDFHVYFGEPGNEIDDKWDRHPDIFKNQPIYTTEHLNQAVEQAHIKWETMSDEEILQIAVEAEILRPDASSTVNPEIDISQPVLRFARALLHKKSKEEPA